MAKSKHRKPISRWPLVAVGAVCILAGCDEGPTSINGVVDAGDDQMVGEGQQVVLQGTASSTRPITEDFGPPFVSFSWRGLLPDDRAIVGDLETDADGKSSFTAPFVDEDIEVELVFTGTDKDDKIASDFLKVLIKNTDGLPGPVIKIEIEDEPELDFFHVIGGSPCPQEVGRFLVLNDGGGDFDFTVIEQPGWVNVTPSSGSAGDVVDVAFNCGGGFVVGANAGLITVSAGQAGTAEVPVTGTVQ